MPSRNRLYQIFGNAKTALWWSLRILQNDVNVHAAVQRSVYVERWSIQRSYDL